MLTSKLVDPVHGVVNSADVFVVQSSSILYPLDPSVGFTAVCLNVVSVVTSGPRLFALECRALRVVAHGHVSKGVLLWPNGPVLLVDPAALGFLLFCLLAVVAAVLAARSSAVACWCVSLLVALAVTLLAVEVFVAALLCLAVALLMDCRLVVLLAGMLVSVV